MVCFLNFTDFFVSLLKVGAARMSYDSLIVILVGNVAFEPNEAPMCAHVATSAVAGCKRQRGQHHYMVEPN